MMYFLNIINSIGDSYLAWKNVYNIIGKILVIMMAYKTLYWLIGVFLLGSLNLLKININMLY